MARSEEEQPLMQGPIADGAATSPAKTGKGRKNGPTLRGAVVTGFIAMGVFIVAALASRTIMWEDSSLASETVYDNGGDSTNASLDAVSGLINPNNGTHPTLTTTEGCTGGMYLMCVARVGLVTVTGRVLCVGASWHAS